MSGPPSRMAAGGAAVPGQRACCAKCGDQIVDDLRLCPVCGTDWGPPNVRTAAAETERGALIRRAEAEVAAAKSRGCATQVEALAKAIQDESHVVLALPRLAARQFLADPRQVYQNYESLVGSGSRVPAAHQNDAKRVAIGGMLFGSSADMVRYGALSLDGRGLGAYGGVFLQLRDVAVRDRTSFLETNSYRFVERFSLKPGNGIPTGFRSTWPDRHYLAVAKLGPQVSTDHSAANWPRLLLQPSGTGRSGDEFIEAHIWGGFIANAVEAVSFSETEAKSREARTDIKVIKHLWQNRQQRPAS